MSIRKQLVITISVLIFISVIVNSVISSQYINNYFKGYLENEYEQKVEKIIRYSTNLIEEESVTKFSVMELENYLDDVIVQIQISDSEGNEILITKNMMQNGHSGMMMNRRFGFDEDHFELKVDGKFVGMVMISKSGTIHNSATLIRYKRALLNGTIGAGLIVLLLAVLGTVFLSKRLTVDLRNTSRYATELETEKRGHINKSKINEIRDIQTTLENLSYKLSMKKKVRKEKIDQISHEARTPLTILRTQLEGVNDGVVSMDSERSESCLREINNLAEILNDIESIIEYSHEKEIKHKETFELVHEIEIVVKGLKLQFEKKGINLSVSGISKKEVQTDKAQLLQGVYNLLTNAYKFTEANGTVNIDIKGEKEVVIEISDTGSGIGKNDLKEIFKAYYRGANSKDIEGDGLGLFIVKQNIENLGGSISVESEIGKGTTFKIIIPSN